MSDYRFVITFKVSNDQRDSILKLLGNKGEVIFLKEIAEPNRDLIIASADILLAWNPVKELRNFSKEKLNGIKFVQLLSAGYDHIDAEQFSKQCLIACNKGAYAEPMAEHILGMILALYKNMLVRHKEIAEGKFDQLTENRTLKNKTCGIIGFGGIGKAVTNLLKPFGNEIYAINTSGKTDRDVFFIGTMNDLDYVLKKSDIVVISIPLNQRTKNLISKRELELMRPDGIIINVARGAIINEEDLFNHLKNNKDFLAGIDAWWSEPFGKGSFELNYPFFELPNFLGSPHNSAVVPGSLLLGAVLAAKNVLNFINEEKIFGLIKK